MGVTRRSLLVIGTIGLDTGLSGCLGDDGKTGTGQSDHDELIDDPLSNDHADEDGVNVADDDEIDADVTVRVGSGNRYTFDPVTLSIDAGQPTASDCQPSFDIHWCGKKANLKSLE